MWGVKRSTTKGRKKYTNKYLELNGIWLEKNSANVKINAINNEDILKSPEKWGEMTKITYKGIIEIRNLFDNKLR